LTKRIVLLHELFLWCCS